MSVRSGTHFNCGVTEDHDALCWGWNPNGLGDGASWISDTPVMVSGGLSFELVGGGFAHSCGVTTRGIAYCWGSVNTMGQLGDGTYVASNEPVRVAPPVF